MRDKIGVPDPDDDEELLVPPSAANQKEEDPEPEETEGGGDSPKPGRAMAFRSAPAQRPPDAFERAIDGILVDEGWMPLVEPIVGGLEEELAEATSIEEARAIFQRRLETMTFFAR